MSTQIQATIQGYDVRATIGTTHAHGTNAHAIAFAPGSSKIAGETREKTFYDYCPADILALLSAEMMPWADGEDIQADLSAAGHECTCPCDCGDDDCGDDQ